MEIRLVNYDGKEGKPVLIIQKTLHPDKHIRVIIEDKSAQVDAEELKAAVYAVSQKRSEGG